MRSFRCHTSLCHILDVSSWFLGASLAGLGAMSATQRSHAKSPEAHSRPRKKLIGRGSDIAYPGKVQNNIRKIEELPLDGIVLSNFSGTKGGKEFTFDWEYFGKQKYERKQLADTRAQCSESPTAWLSLVPTENSIRPNSC